MTKYLRKQLTGGKVYFGSWFQSMVAAPTLWPEVRQNITVVGRGCSPVAARKQRVREQEEESEDKI
jgi:hypothetical protein